MLLEIADRAGFRADFNAALNAWFDLEPPYRLGGDTRYSYEQICDADLKNNFGEEHGLEWFKQHGLIKWKKKPEEVYWRPFTDVRVPIYWEFLKPIGDMIELRRVEALQNRYELQAGSDHSRVLDYRPERAKVPQMRADEQAEVVVPVGTISRWHEIGRVDRNRDPGDPFWGQRTTKERVLI